MNRERNEKWCQTARRSGSLKSFFGKTLCAFAFGALTAMADPTAGTLSALCWYTEYDAPSSVLIDRQAIFAGSQPTVVMKFNRTMSVRATSFNGIYDGKDKSYTINSNNETFAGSGENYDTDHWVAHPTMGDSWVTTHNSFWSSTTTFNASQSSNLANNSWRDNAYTFRLIIDTQSNQKVDPSLIKKVQLWKSRVFRTFSHVNIVGDTLDENGYSLGESTGIVLVEEKTNSGTDWNYEFVIDTDVRETVHDGGLVSSDTTTFFITIQTIDDVSGKNKWNESEENNSRKELEFAWGRRTYYSSSNNRVVNNNTNVSKRRLSINNLTLESCVYDILPYEDYTENFTKSSNDTIFGIKVGPGNEGYPPALPSEFTNSQIKFITVNGIEYYAEDDEFDSSMKQLNDAQSLAWAIGEAQKILMPLSEPFAVLGINIAGTNGDETNNTEYLYQVAVRLDVPDDSSFDPRRDLSNSMQVEEGYENISIYKDVNSNGFFDKEDMEKGLVKLEYDAMSGEISNSNWTKSGKSFQTVLTIAEQENAALYKTQNGISKFFVCVCSNPSASGVTQQPYYGSDFKMAIESVDCHRQHGLADGSLEDEFMSEYTVINDDGSFDVISAPLGSGYDDINDVNINYNDVVSRPVTIALEVTKYVNEQTTDELDHVCPDPLEPDGMQVPVLAINMAGSPSKNVHEKLHSVKVRFAGEDFNPLKHLAPLTADKFSGVSIWKDNKDNKDEETEMLVGVFDPRQGLGPEDPFGGIDNADTLVELSPECLKWYIHTNGADEEWDGEKELSGSDDYFYVLLKFKQAIDLYENDDYYDKNSTGKTSDALGNEETRQKGKYRGRDYFICIRGGAEARDYTDGKRGLDYADTFGVSIVPAEDLLFGYGENAVDAKKLSEPVELFVKGTMPVFFMEPNTTGEYDIYGKTALLAFSVVAPAEGYSFNHFAFQVIDQNGTFAFSDFVDSGDTGDTCGISLWKDNGDGRFDESIDQRIKFRTVDGNDLPKITTMTWHDSALHMIELNLDHESVGELPTTDEGRKADFFLVFQPTKNITLGDKLTLQIWGSDLLGARDDTISFCDMDGNLLANPDGSSRTTPGTYKRFRSKTYVAVEGVEDIDTVDADGDGIPDWFEYTYFGSLEVAGPGNVDGYTDYDNDGLNDYYEFLSGTSPLAKDTDENGVADPDEDFDDDELTNLDEQHWGTHPLKEDDDDDGILDGEEVAGGTSPSHSMNPGYNAALNAAAIDAEGIVVPFTEDENKVGMSTWTVQAMVLSNSALNGILFKKVLSNDKVSFEVGFEDSVLYAKADCYGGKSETAQYPAAVPTDGKWHQVTATWDGGASVLRLVIDGISQHVVEWDYAPVNDWSEIVDNTSHLSGPGAGTDMENVIHREFTFTMLKPEGGAWADGTLFDEIRIWNRSLSTAEICDSKMVIVGEGTEGLLRCFRFDDGGESIEDFAHPARENFEDYALSEGFTDEWCSADAGVALYGFDDEDDDGMPDWYEYFYGINDPFDDADGDGLCNLYEFLAGTEPADKNSDDYDAEAPAGDGMTNGEKQLYGLDPRLADSDGDGISDFDEIAGGEESVYSKNVNSEIYVSNPLNPLEKGIPATLKHISLNGGEGLSVDANAISKYALESWTVMAWIKPASAGQTATIVSRKVSAKEVNYELGIEDGIPYGRFVAKNGTVQVPADTADAPAIELSTEKWTHVAVSFEASTNTMTMFINGTPVAKTINTKKRVFCPAYGNGLDDGGDFAGATMTIGAGYSGLVDSIGIYSGAVSATAVAATFRMAVSDKMGEAMSYIVETEAMAQSAVYAANRTASISSLLAPEHAPDRLIVKFKDVVSAKMIDSASKALGIKVLSQSKLTGAYVVEVPANLDLYDGIAKLRKYDAVEYIVPDYKRSLNATPNDPDFSKLWGLYNNGQTGGTAGMDIGAKALWDEGVTGSNDVIVAVIDSGVDCTHPDLKANMWTNSGETPDNGIDDDGNGIIDDYYGMASVAGALSGDPVDEHSHGTHVSGTIGAVGNNGVGVVGVNWNVKIMALKMFDATGKGGLDSDEVACIEYAIAHGAKIINFSLGSSGYSPAEYDALVKAREAGVLAICAAGNDNLDNDVAPHYPSSYTLDNIVAVAAMDDKGLPTNFTHWGKNSVDVAAPGLYIYSTLPRNVNTYGNTYGYMSGTSMATPHVTGMAALLKAAYPNATYAALRNAIIGGAEKVSGWETKPIATMGRVSIENANELLSKLGGGLVACFRGNGALEGSHVLDLTEQELGAGVVGIGIEAPEVCKAAFGEFSLEEADDDSKAALSGDTDGDGMPDWYEVAMGHDIENADADVDSDGDKLTNYFEYLAGTSPWLKKTDGKKVDREYTVEFSADVDYKKAQDLKINPKSGVDTDDDGVTDQDEAGYGEAEETSAPDNALSPAVERVLRISGADSYLEIPNAAEYALTKNWTVDLWVKIDPEFDGDAILVRRAIDTELTGDEDELLINYEVGLQKEADGWRPYARFSSSDGERVCLANATIAADVQTHIGASYDSENNRMIIGIDNSAMASVDCDGYGLPDEFGLSFVRVGEGFLGEIDSVRIWNSATDSFYNYKSATQDATAGKVENGLVGSFIFDDGGVTAQNFAVAKEDWKTGWVNAAVLVGDAIEMTVVGEAQAPIEPISEGEDSDGDGLPDAWEMEYFGNLEQGADDDPDEDGLTNMYEYWAGTDPTVKKTDGINNDATLDPDGDKVCNLDEQYYSTRPDMADTDDDGVSDGIELGYDENEVNYGYEVSSPLNSLEQPYMTSQGHVSEDEYGDALGIMSEASISKIFRMVGDNWMLVKDNPAHSGRNMSFSFWIRGNMLSGTTFDKDADLPTTDTVFMRRSVVVDKNELSNYRFSISKKAIKFQFAQKATTERFTNVQYAPADGIKTDTWYHVSAVAALDASAPYIAISVSTLDSSSGKYVPSRTDKPLTNTNAETMSGDEGTLTLGHSSSNGLVLDVDDLNIWNFEKNIDDIDVTYQEPPTEEGAEDAEGDKSTTAAADAEETLEEGQYHSVFKFDDGGKSAEDFGFASDWMASWRHAGLLNLPSEQPTSSSVGRGMIHIGDTAESSSSPSNPVIEIQTLTNIRNEETGLVEFCYRPTSDDADKNEFDLLSAAILTEANDPEGLSIYYGYYWLKGDRTSGALTFENGEMLYDGQSVAKFLLSNVAKLDLYASRADVAVGDVITLAVVAVNSSGKASEVQVATVTVTTGEEFSIPAALEYVSFNPSSPNAGSTLTVTVKTADSSCDGFAVIEWFRNGMLYSAERKEVTGIQTVSFSQGGSKVTVNGDVWHFKAYYEGKPANGSAAAVKSRAIPPAVLPSDKDAITVNADGDYISGNYIYRLIGKPYEGEHNEDGTNANNKPPTTPTAIAITPDIADKNSIFIATASGSRDPNGDLFSYHYQWYVDGVAVAGANMPYYPSDLVVYDADKDTFTITAAKAMSAGTYVSVEAYAVDIFGSRSPSMFSEARYVYDDLTELYNNDDETWAYEPNDLKAQATRIMPKADWYDVEDDNTQVHYFHKQTDVDWFWFVVPETMVNRKKLVKFETTAAEAKGMYDKMHLMSNDGDPDTQLSLFRQGSNKRLLYCDDYGNTSSYGGTKFARFEMELDPGIYYVQVSLASTGYNGAMQTSTWTPDMGYRVHLGITEKPGQSVPTAPTSVVITPSEADCSDDLVCHVTGSHSIDGSTSSIKYYYVWYRDNELVPFGNSSQVLGWDSDRYIISQAKNFASAKYGAPNTIPASLTSEGQRWYCVVYAADSNGYSIGSISNVVTVGTSTWAFDLGVSKTYSKSSIGSVMWEDQKVTLGWIEEATFGFDPGCDSALPTQMLPGSTTGVYRPLPQGRMFSIGLDNTKTALSTDYRPYGKASSWFIKIEVGDDSLSEMTLSWDSTVEVPTSSVDGLMITRMSQSADGTFLPIEGTTQSMSSIESITLTSTDVESMQTDENGQKFVVFRVSLGAPDSIQMMSLKAGWNMVSFSVSPLNNAVEDVFSDGAGNRYYRGVVYEYVNGQYVVAKTIVPTRGYWVFAPKAVTFNVYGNVETTSIKLNKGWNIAGPVYNIPDFKSAYADYASVVSPDNIFEFISTPSGATSYEPVLNNGKYPLSVGKAYWIYAERDVELPLIQIGE